MSSARHGVFEHNHLRFTYREAGSGLPFIFQHGLGGDATQIFSLFQPPSGIHLLTLECRGHGQSSLGPEDEIGLGTYAADLRAFMKHLGIDKAVIGGISMGAAIATQFALRWPDEVLGLVISRPAWLDSPHPGNVRVFPLIAGLMGEFGPTEALRRFRETPEHAAIRAESPDTIASLEAQFFRRRAVETRAILQRIPGDRPYSSLDELTSIRVPTLVLGNRQDPVHPFSYAEAIAARINGSVLHELTPKSVSTERHREEVQRHLEDFLLSSFAAT